MLLGSLGAPRQWMTKRTNKQTNKQTNRQFTFPSVLFIYNPSIFSDSFSAINLPKKQLQIQVQIIIYVCAQSICVRLFHFDVVKKIEQWNMSKLLAWVSHTITHNWKASRHKKFQQKNEKKIMHANKAHVEINRYISKNNVHIDCDERGRCASK